MTTGKTILLAGGAGYIGSHTVVELLAFGFRVVVIDDLSNSQECDDEDMPPALRRAITISGQENLHFIQGNISDYDKLNSVFDNFNIDTVFDFTGRKAVGESTRLPILYYKHNLKGTLTLLKCMRQHGVRNLVFSSSCTVYGAPDQDSLPIKETADVGNCHCPYAKCKYMIENVLEDMSRSEPQFWRIMIMRYFNPVGAHESGLIGEDPKGEPLNLMPKLAQVASGKQPSIEIYGEEYNTKDGSAIRDYVHIVDVAKSHLKAIQKFEDINGIEVYNIGSGQGRSTFDMLRAFEGAIGRTLPIRVRPRRSGDVDQVYCDPSKAEKELGWKAERSHQQMCRDLWRFYQLNPNGYQDSDVLDSSGIAF